MKLVSKLTALAVGAAALSGAAWAQKAPEYVSIPMEITVNKPAKDVWAKVGGWCDISNWISAAGPVPCEVTSGKDQIGAVRVIAKRVTEVLTAKTELAYGYTQPAVEGKFYNLYHGFLEARPVDAKSSKLVYTLMLDVSDKPDQAAKDADVAARRKQFEAALANMKKIAEAG